MFAQEAAWLSDRLQGLPVDAVSPLLNVGSSDRRFREQVQPYIDRVLFAPQVERGVRVIHCDRKPHDGVDLVADIFEDEGLARMAAAGPRALVCSNVHEHVRDPGELSRRLLGLVPAGGHLLVTVPHSYPYHEDPIDTLYRPSPDELAALHPGTEVVAQARVTAGTYRDSLRADPWRLFGDLAEQAGTLVRRRAPAGALRLRWWSRAYAVSCVLLRKL